MNQATKRQTQMKHNPVAWTVRCSCGVSVRVDQYEQHQRDSSISDIIAEFIEKMKKIVLSQ